jgi:predicted PilT family ATPase
MFKIISPADFGFYTAKNQLSYFVGNNERAALQITSGQQLTIEIKNWSRHKMKFVETADQVSAEPLAYVLHQLEPGKNYSIYINGVLIKKIRSNKNGDIFLNHKVSAHSELVTVLYEN